MTEKTNRPKNFSEFKQIVNAEDYFQFFELPYDQQFVNVNRLHILKQFSLLMKEIDKVFPDLSDEERLSKYREALEEAYQVFLTSSPLETKLFKVFQEKPKNVVLLQDIGIS
ncbi:MAG TPA: nitrogenase stabilizing/protective protein [Cyanobacteria bacterium UBA8803]|nr:nitrogenase stabilizing/protective protein [Cyanobacteria bacterium UBA9273]HBL61637.1 nitrogenase stabilizing/protective protein [Cyanobacteria bacterium UBA8803]